MYSRQVWTDSVHPDQTDRSGQPVYNQIRQTGLGKQCTPRSDRQVWINNVHPDQTDRSGQTVYTQIRWTGLAVYTQSRGGSLANSVHPKQKGQSEQVLHYRPFRLVPFGCITLWQSSFVQTLGRLQQMFMVEFY